MRHSERKIDSRICACTPSEGSHAGTQRGRGAADRRPTAPLPRRTHRGRSAPLRPQRALAHPPSAPRAGRTPLSGAGLARALPASCAKRRRDSLAAPGPPGRSRCAVLRAARPTPPLPRGASPARAAAHRLQEVQGPHVVPLGAEDLVEDAEAEAQLAVGVLGAAGGLRGAGGAGWRRWRRLHGGGRGVRRSASRRAPRPPQEPPMAARCRRGWAAAPPAALGAASPAAGGTTGAGR